MAVPKTRSDYLESMLDLEKIEKATLSILKTDPQTDVPIGDPIVTATVIRMQSAQIPQEERVQSLVSSSDDGKMIFYGRATRVYGVSGFLVDTKLSRGQGSTQDEKKYAGHMMARWDSLYERFLRATICIRNGWIAQIKFRKSTWNGYVLSNVKGIDASNPHLCMVNFTFMSLFESEDVVIPRTESDGLTEFAGTVSLENYERITGVAGLISAEDPTAAGNTAVGRYMAGDRSEPIIMEIVPPEEG